MPEQQFIKQALHYHRHPTPGKLSIAISKSTDSQEDLALAYSPGVAHPVLEIARDSELAYEYTSKGNLVAVISNGTAILGLGDKGALASKPVMEGKAVLFKRFGNVDVFDIEVDCKDPQQLVETITHIAPTFGGINLEDIKAPECFYIEQELQKRLNIPVFHDDQHGTAIVVSAGLLNALELQGKTLQQAKIVCLGAGAAGIASMNMLMDLGARRDHIFMIDRGGVIHSGRADLGPYKQPFAHVTDQRSLADAIIDADVFIGLSGPNLLSAEMLASMAPRPIIFALSNPNPEISVELAHQVRSDLIIATGRSDYPNQVNNVLCFPYIFRGALDVRAHAINKAMQHAAVEAIRRLTHEEVPVEVLKAYPAAKNLVFGSDYILPKPVDPRLCAWVAPAVAKAAVDSGVGKI